MRGDKRRPSGEFLDVGGEVGDGAEQAGGLGGVAVEGGENGGVPEYHGIGRQRGGGDGWRAVGRCGNERATVLPEVALMIDSCVTLIVELPV